MEKKKTRPSSFKRRKTLGDTQKSENWDVSFVPEKKRSEEGRRGVAALVVHSLEVCVFVSSVYLTLHALCCRRTVLDLHDDL